MSHFDPVRRQQLPFGQRELSRPGAVPGTRPHRRPGRKQDGISLVIVLILLIAATFLGVSAGIIALQAEKASRGDRDRQIAFQAAEAALIDAQRDIDTAPTGAGARQRAAPFARDSAAGFPASEQAQACNPASDPSGFGLCRRALAGAPATWLAVDLTDTTSNGVSVPYGSFTGQSFPVGQGSLPALPPRYVIELMNYSQPGQDATVASYAYRITAIGFGSNSKTQVVLQAFYRKEE
ncbi:MAG: pilus assembly protein [Herminiimonas sp.]|nr:pilus assembly protein [Herminiimonas sp.]